MTFLLEINLMKQNFLWLLCVISLACANAHAFHDESTTDQAAPEKETPLLTYGNWCGAGHPKNIKEAGEPINLLDAACKAHDICYLVKGDMSCECDEEFNQKIISGLKQNRFSGNEKIFARTFRIYFKGSPCVGNHKDKIAPSRAIQNTYKKANARTVKILNSLPFSKERAIQDQ